MFNIVFMRMCFAFGSQSVEGLISAGPSPFSFTIFLLFHTICIYIYIYQLIEKLINYPRLPSFALAEWWLNSPPRPVYRYFLTDFFFAWSPFTLSNQIHYQWCHIKDFRRHHTDQVSFQILKLCFVFLSLFFFGCIAG